MRVRDTICHLLDNFDDPLLHDVVLNVAWHEVHVVQDGLQVLQAVLQLPLPELMPLLLCPEVVWQQ